MHACRQTASDEQLSTCLNLSHSSRFSARGLLCRSKDKSSYLHPSFSFIATLDTLSSLHCVKTIISLVHPPIISHTICAAATSTTPCYFCLPSWTHLVCSHFSAPPHPHPPPPHGVAVPVALVFTSPAVWCVGTN